jgi:MFS family permease
MRVQSTRALVKAAQALEMHGATLSCPVGTSVSTLAWAATMLLLGFLGDRLGRRRLLMAALLLSIAGDGIAMAGIAVGGVLVLTFAAV